jgi:hypothetical protein
MRKSVNQVETRLVELGADVALAVEVKPRSLVVLVAHVAR